MIQVEVQLNILKHIVYKMKDLNPSGDYEQAPAQVDTQDQVYYYPVVKMENSPCLCPVMH